MIKPEHLYRELVTKRPGDKWQYHPSVDLHKRDGKGRIRFKSMRDGVEVFRVDIELDNGRRNGFGRIDSSDGSFFEGHFKDNVPNGEGCWDQTATVGVSYSGEFVNGKFHGTGKWVDARLRREYRGEFADNKFHGSGVLSFLSAAPISTQVFTGVWKAGVLRHGKLSFSHEDAFFCHDYEGEFERYMFHGRGKLVKYNYTYDGGWKFGKQHGVGLMTQNPGKSFLYQFLQADFRDGECNGFGKFESLGTVYEGGLERALPNGEGKMTTSFYTYQGHFLLGQRAGRGQIEFTNGDKYVGDWYGGRRNGEGIETRHNGDKYEGSWKNDEKHGRGVETLADGSTFTGQFKEGVRHGRGTEVDADGNSFSGQWVHGEKKGGRKRKRPDNDKADLTCPICFDKNKNVVFDVCRHTLCGECADKLPDKKCPMCKKLNTSVDPIFL